MERRFDVVLVFHTSRFARNTVEAKRYKKLLRSELGIDVISVTQSLGADTNDPAAFLSESVHEIFDEYYSVSLSFWTRWACARKPAKDCSPAPCRGVGQGTRRDPRPRHKEGTVRGASLRAVRDRPAHRPHTRRVAEPPGPAHKPRPHIHLRHRARDALQRHLRRLRLRPPRPQQGNQRAAPSDRARGVVRPRATHAPSARPHDAPGTPLAAIRAPWPRALPALPRTDAGHHRRARPQSTLLLRQPPRQPLLRPADHLSRDDRAPTRAVHRRLHAHRRRARGDPSPPCTRHARDNRGGIAPGRPGGAPQTRPRPV
jgi:Resolvase, N terminal domain